MTSDLSDALNSFKLNGDRIRLSSSNSNQRRHWGSGQKHRFSIQSKRSVTIDAESDAQKLRIVILGATRVGKTCLCQQFLQQKFLMDHKETVDEMYSVELSVVDRRIILEILDTAGIDEFPVMRRLAIAHGDAFLIVYAINDPSSFDIARQMRQLVLEIKGELNQTSVPMIIVANKSDLNSEIPRDYAETVVNDQWSSKLIETSCHQRESVLNAFRHLLAMANVQIEFNSDFIRRSSDPNLFENKESRHSSKRQSCAQQ